MITSLLLNGSNTNGPIYAIMFQYTCTSMYVCDVCLIQLTDRGKWGIIIHLIAVLRHTREYFTYLMTAKFCPELLIFKTT